MTSLWTRVELLVSQVQRPGRCIGCEYGVVAPRHKPGKVGGLLADPDTDEIGLPDQGLQILYELLNERDDAVVERPHRDPDASRDRGPAVRTHPLIEHGGARREVISLPAVMPVLAEQASA